MNATPADTGQPDPALPSVAGRFRIRAYDSAVVRCVPCTWYLENVKRSAAGVLGIIGDQFRSIDLAEIAALTALHECPPCVTAAYESRDG